MKRKSTISSVEVLSILIGSVLLLAIYTKFHFHAFVGQDNYYQFFPMIQSVYDYFMEHGHFPIYDFYQMKGYSFADGFIYGHGNVLLFLCYLVSRFLLPFTDLVNLYVYVTFTLGNLLIFCLLRRLGISKWASWLCIASLVTCAGYFTVGYWYYVWNNYLLIPLLLWSVLYLMQHHNWRGYLLSGMVLAYSITMGNIQYTMYHYIIFGIMMVVLLMAYRDLYYLKALLSNVFLSFVLAIPIFMMLVQAGARREVTINVGMFLIYPISYYAQMICSFLPQPVFYHFWYGEPFLIERYWAPTVNQVTYGFMYTGIFFGCFLILTVILLVKGIGRLVGSIAKKVAIPKASAEETEKWFIISIFVTIAFYILWGLGTRTPIAPLLSHIPLLNSTRYLFKVFFIEIPLYPFVAGYVLDRCFMSRRSLAIVTSVVTACFVLMGGYTNYWLFNSGEHIVWGLPNTGDLVAKAENTKARIEALGLDTENYRFLTFLHADDPQDQNTFVVKSEYEDWYLTRDLPTLIGVYTIAGMDNSLNMTAYTQTTHIYENMNQFDWMSAAPGSLIAANCADEEYRRALVDEMLANDVRYLLFEKDSSSYKDLMALLATDERVTLSEPVDFVGDAVLVIMDGADGMATAADGTQLSCTGDYDTLSIAVDEKTASSEIHLSMTYEERLYATFTGEDGKKTSLDLSADAYGDLVIRGIPEGSAGNVTVGYSNPLYHVGILDCWMITALFILLLMIKRKETTH